MEFSKCLILKVQSMITDLNDLKSNLRHQKSTFLEIYSDIETLHKCVFSYPAYLYFSEKIKFNVIYTKSQPIKFGL